MTRWLRRLTRRHTSKQEATVEPVSPPHIDSAAPSFLPEDDLLSLGDLATRDRGALERCCRERVRVVYLDNGTAVCRVFGQRKLFVDLLDLGFAPHVLLDGFWEMWVTMFLARYLRPAMTVIDMGAGSGYHTLLMAEAVTGEGRVYALESEPKSARMLKDTIALNGMSGRADVEEAGFPELFDLFLKDSSRLDLIRVATDELSDEMQGMLLKVAEKHRPAVLIGLQTARATRCFDELAHVYGGVQLIDDAGNVASTTLSSVESGPERTLLFSGRA